MIHKLTKNVHCNKSYIKNIIFANKTMRFMDAKRILDYLKRLMANNSREWYWEHKAEYDAVRADFEEGIKLATISIKVTNGSTR